MSARFAPRSRTLLRSHCIYSRQHVRPAVRGYASTPEQNENKSPVSRDAPRKDFQSQVLQSAYDRVQREKADRKRFAQINEEKPPSTLARGVSLVVFSIFLFSAGNFWANTRAPKSLPPTSTLPLSATPSPQHDTRPATMQALWGDMRDIVGKDNVLTDKSELEAHSGSSWSTHPSLPGDTPFMIVKPGSTEDVSKIMKACWERKVPVTAYSGGTSLEGHFAATKGGICVDFSRMNQIVKLRKEDLDVTVQPAVGWESLNEELEKEGLFFPPDPGPGAMIGGMVGTGCSGTNAYRYGTMKDWVLSLTVVLADGTVVKTRQRPRKSSAGYDLTRLFVGSEGTLGLVTEAVLKLTPRPQAESVAVSAFPDVRSAAEAVFKVVGAGVPIGAVEILDDEQMRCINEAGMTSKRWKVAPTLFFKFIGTPASIKEHVSQVKSLAKSAGCTSFEFANRGEEAAELWSARKEALWSTMAQKKHEGERIWTTDVAVPISRLPEIIDETKADIKSSGLVGTIVGHVGDGNFHSIIVYDPEKPAEYRKVKEVVRRMVLRAIEMEGTATGEHGVGLVKRDYLNRELGPDTVDLLRRIKVALDPLCLLNCDKVVRVAQPGAGEVEE